MAPYGGPVVPEVYERVKISEFYKPYLGSTGLVLPDSNKFAKVITFIY
jgi:hypothetical protein